MLTKYTQNQTKSENEKREFKFLQNISKLGCIEIMLFSVSAQKRQVQRRGQDNPSWEILEVSEIKSEAGPYHTIFFYQCRKRKRCIQMFELE